MSLLNNSAVDGASLGAFLYLYYKHLINSQQGTEEERRNAFRIAMQNEPFLTTMSVSSKVFLSLAGLFSSWGLCTYVADPSKVVNFSIGFLVSVGGMGITDNIFDVFNSILRTAFPSSLRLHQN